jgi:opacity protein-like surface antigen
MRTIGRPSGTVPGLVLVTLATLASAPAFAVDVLGVYVGAAGGRGQVETGSLESPVPATVPIPPDFKANHSAFKLVAGIRPLSLIGAEVAYIDFGHPSKSLGSGFSTVNQAIGYSASGDVRLNGTAAFGILYLPIPVVDVYAKAGMARLKTTANVTLQLSVPIATCVVAQFCQVSQQSSRTDTGFAAGAGVGFKLGPVAIHAEYERFSTSGAFPALTTLGVTYTFL